MALLSTECLPALVSFQSQTYVGLHLRRQFCSPLPFDDWQIALVCCRRRLCAVCGPRHTHGRNPAPRPSLSCCACRRYRPALPFVRVGIRRRVGQFSSQNQQPGRAAAPTPIIRRQAARRPPCYRSDGPPASTPSANPPLEGLTALVPLPPAKEGPRGAVLLRLFPLSLAAPPPLHKRPHPAEPGLDPSDLPNGRLPTPLQQLPYIGNCVTPRPAVRRPCNLLSTARPLHARSEGPIGVRHPPYHACRLLNLSCPFLLDGLIPTTARRSVAPPHTRWLFTRTHTHTHTHTHGTNPTSRTRQPSACFSSPHAAARSRLSI